MPYKQAESVLIVIHVRCEHILLMERADHPGWWQSVTGSLEQGESPLQTALRELAEETGLSVVSGQLHDWHLTNRYAIYPEFLYRYPPGTTHNIEHVFSLGLSQQVPISLSPKEHLRYEWVTYSQAATRCFSPSNQSAIQHLGALQAQQAQQQ